jgi:hypothetical protein
MLTSSAIPALARRLVIPSWGMASPPRPGHHHVDTAAAALRANQSPSQAVPAARAGGSLLIAAVLARPLPVPVIKRVTEPARRQNASKCHQQGNDKRCPQDHRVYPDGVLSLYLVQTSRLPHARTDVSAPTSVPAQPGRVRSGDHMPCTRP